MFHGFSRTTRALASAAVVALIGAAFTLPALAGHIASKAASGAGHKTRLVMPSMNPINGKKLFVAKGCVACHAVNGVGGHDAPSMDAHSEGELMNLFDFAAMMWNHAPAMIAAQEDAFGEQLYFTGEELADIIAFVHDDLAQHSFTEADLTPKALKMMHHEHGGIAAPAAHADEIGHSHPPGTPKHKD
ncbi:MAG: c-type cytochrome [Rhodospirillales bacterium]